MEPVVTKQRLLVVRREALFLYERTWRDALAEPLEAGLEIRHAFKQDRIQPSTNIVQGELPTDGYTEINLDVSYEFDLTAEIQLTLFARVSNLLDEERRLHTSFLKDVAPLPGRNFTLGGRFEF